METLTSSVYVKPGVRRRGGRNSCDLEALERYSVCVCVYVCDLEVLVRCYVCMCLCETRCKEARW
jgi:hypothetical protein